MYIKIHLKCTSKICKEIIYSSIFSTCLNILNRSKSIRLFVCALVCLFGCVLRVSSLHGPPRPKCHTPLESCDIWECHGHIDFFIRPRPLRGRGKNLPPLPLFGTKISDPSVMVRSRTHYGFVM